MLRVIVRCGSIEVCDVDECQLVTDALWGRIDGDTRACWSRRRRRADYLPAICTHVGELSMHHNANKRHGFAMRALFVTRTKFIFDCRCAGGSARESDVWCAALNR